MPSGVYERTAEHKAKISATLSNLALGEGATVHGHVRGKKRSPTNMTWYAMKQRCLNPKAINYPQYGGRGIKVCEQWRSFENFLADMGERPDGCTLHRIEGGTSGYEPGNCEWAPNGKHPPDRPRLTSADGP
jgi:hypothetical protein